MFRSYYMITTKNKIPAITVVSSFVFHSDEVSKWATNQFSRVTINMTLPLH